MNVHWTRRHFNKERKINVRQKKNHEYETVVGSWNIPVDNLFNCLPVSREKRVKRKSIDSLFLFFFILIWMKIHLRFYLCNERHGTCWGIVFHFASFESQYLYEQVDVIMVAVVENYFPTELLDVQVFLAWAASMHATIWFSFVSPTNFCDRSQNGHVQ